MANETLYPDAILVQTGLAGTISAINGAEDGTWLTSSGSNGELRVSFPSPSGPLTDGANLQTFRFYVRKNAAGGGDPAITSVELYENGVLRQTLVSSKSTITSATGEVFTDPWDASNLVGDGSGVEVRVVFTKGGGGPNERNVELDSVSWIVDYTIAAPTVNSGPVSGSGSGVGSALAVALTPVGSGSVSGSGAGIGSATATVTTPAYILEDTFTDTNGTLLTSHTPDIDIVGGGWAGSNHFDIQSNKATIAAGAVGNQFVGVDIGTAVGEYTVTVDNTNANWFGVYFGGTSTSGPVPLSVWWVEYES